MGGIRGIITDEDTGEPIIGVSVGIKGSSKGTATRADGFFYIPPVPAGQEILTARSVGYAPKEIPVSV